MAEPQKSYTPEELWAKITAKSFRDDISIDPEQHHKLFISNIVGRSISYQVGYTGKIWTPIAVTDSGKTEVNQVASGYQNDASTTFAGVGSSKQVEDLGAVCDEVWISLSSGNLRAEFSIDGVTYGSTFYLAIKAQVKVPRQARYVRIRDDGSTASGEVYGFY